MNHVKMAPRLLLLWAFVRGGYFCLALWLFNQGEIALPPHEQQDPSLAASAEDMVALGYTDAAVLKGHQIELPVHPDVQSENYGKVLDVLTQQACDEQFQLRTDSQELLQLRDFEHASRLKLLGNEGFEQLQAFRQETDDKLAKLQLGLRNSGSEKLESGLASLKKQRKDDKLLLIKKLGIDVTSLEKLDEGVNKRFSLLGDSDKGGDAEVADVHMNDDVPGGAGSFKSGEKSSDGTIRNAPYTSAWSSSGYRPPSGFTIENEYNIARANNGEFNNKIAVYDLNAGDFDLVWIEQKARVGFWYFPFSSSGSLELLIKGISLGTVHRFRVSDEFGFSSFSTDQSLRLVATATDGQRFVKVKPLISALELSHSVNQSLLFSPIERTDYRPLKVYWFKIALRQEFGPFAPVWIEFGFDCRLKTRTNDYAIYASINSAWHLVGLKVRLT